MPVQRKVFRIEERARAGECATIPFPLDDDAAAQRHQELMAALSTLRALLEQRAPAPKESAALIEEEITRAHEFKHELDLIHEAIRRTKQDVAGVAAHSLIGPQMARVGRELDAVISGTEQATQSILKSAEDIDQIANTLSSMLKGGYTQGLAQDMRDHVVKIFEACNFQDLTGQRIGKVVATLNFIEEHVNRMRELWSEISKAATSISASPSTMRGDSEFLNGPRLPDDLGHSTQAEIDLIFNRG